MGRHPPFTSAISLSGAARAMATASGMPDYQWLTVQYPYALTVSGTRQRQCSSPKRGHRKWSPRSPPVPTGHPEAHIGRGPRPLGEGLALDAASVLRDRRRHSEFGQDDLAVLSQCRCGPAWRDGAARVMDEGGDLTDRTSLRVLLGDDATEAPVAAILP